MVDAECYLKSSIVSERVVSHRCARRTIFNREAHQDDGIRRPSLRHKVPISLFEAAAPPSSLALPGQHAPGQAPSP